MDRPLRQEYLFSRCGVALSEATILDLRGQGLVTLKGLEACSKLSVLYASRNKLTALDGLEHNAQLWRIDVSDNELQSVNPLQNLPAIGYLNLSGTGLTFQQLMPLRSMFVLELETARNPKLQLPGLTLAQNRLVLVHLLPRVWVLDGIFVTLQERAAALDMFTNADDVLLTATRDLVSSARRPRPWNPSSSVSEIQRAFQEVIVRQPDRPERVEPFQLRIYATFYSHDAHRVSKYGRERGSGDRSLAALYMPSLHLSDLLRLPAAQLTDVASLLTATVEYNVPREILSDALTVLQLPVPHQVINDWSRLSPALVSCVLHTLYEAVMDKTSIGAREALSAAAACAEHTLDCDRLKSLTFDDDSSFSAMDYFQQQIWASYPRGGILPCPNIDVWQTYSTLSTKRYTTFPPELPASAEAPAPRSISNAPPPPPAESTELALTDGYDSDPEAKMRRASVAATMANVDRMLAIEDAGEKSTSSSVVSAVATRARHAAVLLSRSPLFPPMITRAGDKLPRKELMSNFVKLFPLLKAAGLADVTGHKTATGRRKTAPQVTTLAVHLDSVAPLDSEWDTSMVASSLWSHDEGRSQGDQQRSESDPAPLLSVSPHHVPSRPGPAIRLHRTSEAFRKSGLPGAAGVLNIAIPSEFVQEMRHRRLAAEAGAAPAKSGQQAAAVPMAQMRAWVLNGTWDANFVLASTDMIAAENKAASLLGAFDGVDVRAGGWVELDTVPFSLMSRGAPASGEPSVNHNEGAFEIDGIFRADERPFVRRHPVEKKSPHSRSDKADGGPLLLPTAQPIPAIADVPATEVPKHDSDNTFLTGVDIVDEPPPDQAAHATTAPVVSELALPTAPEPVHRAATFSTTLRDTPKLAVTSRSYRSDVAGPVTDATGKLAEKTWYAMPARQQFRVSADPVAFQGVRTRPILPPSTQGSHAISRQHRQPTVAALVPTTNPPSLPSPEPVMMPTVPHRSAHSRKASVASTKSGSSKGSRVLASEFGLVIAPGSRPMSPVVIPDMPNEFSTEPSVVIESQLGGGEDAVSEPVSMVAGTQDHPPEVDEDGIYTVSVPGAGKVFVATDGPAPDVDLLADFAKMMNASRSNRPARRQPLSSAGASDTPKSVLAASGRLAVKQP